MRALLLAVLLAACATPPPAPTFDLTGTQWHRSDDDNAAPHFPTLSFTADGASGFAGCNRWFAAVTRDAYTLRFGNVGTTRMACQAESQAATERSFLEVIENTRGYHTDEDELTLLNEVGAKIAEFERDDQ